MYPPLEEVNMIYKFVHGNTQNLNKWLEPLLFTFYPVYAHFSTQLLFGCKPCSVLDIVWEKSEGTFTEQE